MIKKQETRYQKSIQPSGAEADALEWQLLCSRGRSAFVEEDRSVALAYPPKQIWLATVLETLALELASDGVVKIGLWEVTLLPASRRLDPSVILILLSRMERRPFLEELPERAMIDGSGQYLEHMCCHRHKYYHQRRSCVWNILR